MYQLGHAAVFTGDTVFLESVGRPDLADQAEPFAHSLYRSRARTGVAARRRHHGLSRALRRRRGGEGHEFVARPLGELRSRCRHWRSSESEFVAWALANVKDRPPNYQHIVSINAGRETVDDESAQLELGPNRCAVA